MRIQYICSCDIIIGCEIRIRVLRIISIGMHALIKLFSPSRCGCPVLFITELKFWLQERAVLRYCSPTIEVLGSHIFTQDIVGFNLWNHLVRTLLIEIKADTAQHDNHGWHCYVNNEHVVSGLPCILLGRGAPLIAPFVGVPGRRRGRRRRGARRRGWGYWCHCAIGIVNLSWCLRGGVDWLYINGRRKRWVVSLIRSGLTSCLIRLSGSLIGLRCLILCLVFTSIILCCAIGPSCCRILLRCLIWAGLVPLSGIVGLISRIILLCFCIVQCTIIGHVLCGIICLGVIRSSIRCII